MAELRERRSELREHGKRWRTARERTTEGRRLRSPRIRLCAFREKETYVELRERVDGSDQDRRLRMPVRRDGFGFPDAGIRRIRRDGVVRVRIRAVMSVRMVVVCVLVVVVVIVRRGVFVMAARVRRDMDVRPGAVGVHVAEDTDVGKNRQRRQQQRQNLGCGSRHAPTIPHYSR